MSPVLEFSYRHRLSHLSSTLSAYPIIRDIYGQMGPEDRFVLSQGHAAAAWWVVLGERGADADALLARHGVHPHRNVADGVWVSTGSLGMGITVALGMAMAGRTVHCLVSDGECAEGSVWEALRLARQFCEDRLRVYVNYNAMSALGTVEPNLIARLYAFYPAIRMCYSAPVDLPFTRGLEAHYHVITDAEWATYKEGL